MAKSPFTRSAWPQLPKNDGNWSKIIGGLQNFEKEFLYAKKLPFHGLKISVLPLERIVKAKRLPRVTKASCTFCSFDKF
jgi:hypothetical protein